MHTTGQSKHMVTGTAPACPARLDVPQLRALPDGRGCGKRKGEQHGSILAGTSKCGVAWSTSTVMRLR